MEILIDNRQSTIDTDLQELGRKTERVLEELGCSPRAVLSISLVEKSEMSRLNSVFRGKEGPTNVLSFSQLEGKPVGAGTEILGDVVICSDVAAEDAVGLGYSPEEMVFYLLVHGILHIVGYNHDVSGNDSAMRARLEEIFQVFYSGLE